MQDWMTDEEAGIEYTVVEEDPFKNSVIPERPLFNPDKNVALNFLQHWDNDNAEFVIEGGEEEDEDEPIRNRSQKRSLFAKSKAWKDKDQHPVIKTSG